MAIGGFNRFSASRQLGSFRKDDFLLLSLRDAPKRAFGPIVLAVLRLFGDAQTTLFVRVVFIALSAP